MTHIQASFVPNQLRRLQATMGLNRGWQHDEPTTRSVQLHWGWVTLKQDPFLPQGMHASHSDVRGVPVCILPALRGL